MKKVLIVDDSALMRRVLSDIINDDEQLIVEKTANNGLEALNVLQGGCRPDILLVDINMPKMDGVQLLKELNKYRIQIPVLIVSSIASQSADETIEALALGAFDFVKKPNGSIGGGYQEFRKKVLLRTYMACKLPLPKRLSVNFRTAVTGSEPIKKCGKSDREEGEENRKKEGAKKWQGKRRFGSDCFFNRRTEGITVGNSVFSKGFSITVSRCPAYAGRIYEVISSSLE